MNQLTVKAFVVCNEITESPGESGQKDLRGAGLTQFHSAGNFPIRRTFWVYFEVLGQQQIGRINWH